MMKSGKLLGYCPNCSLAIASFDVKKGKRGTVYTCNGCGEEKGLEKLEKERRIEPKIEDKELDEIIDEIEE
jgi:hypothetical protein